MSVFRESTLFDPPATFPITFLTMFSNFSPIVFPIRSTETSVRQLYKKIAAFLIETLTILIKIKQGTVREADDAIEIVGNNGASKIFSSSSKMSASARVSFPLFDFRLENERASKQRI